MRRVTLGSTGIETSALGFGAASLGSRVDPDTAARALAAALDAGVTWIDLAPVYGGGRAEEIAGKVLRGRRDQVQICTKVGLKLAGGMGGGLRGALMPLARKVIGRLGPLSGALRKAAPKANARLPLTPELIRTSIEESLRRLGTDRIEVYALHALLLAALVGTTLACAGRPRRWWLIGLVAGLGLAHHRTTVLFLPGVAAAMWLAGRATARKRDAVVQ